jgi:lipopolysaccharide export system permease protein
MVRLLHRYLLREIAVPFLLGLVTFTAILLAGRFMKLAELVVVKGVPFRDLLRLILYLLPGFALFSLPMAFLLAVLMAFGRLSADSEITALKAGGIGLHQLLPPVLLFAGLVTLATTFVSVYAIPWGNTSFKELLFRDIEQRATVGLREKVFNADFPGVVIYADRLDDRQHTMEQVIIQDERDTADATTIFAERGQLAADAARHSLQVHLINGTIHRRPGTRDYRLVSFQTYDLRLNLARDPKKFTRSESDLTLAELLVNARSPQLARRLQREMHVEYHRRFALPFASFVFALVGVPLGIQNQRTGKGAGFAVSIGVFVLYYVLFVAAKTLGERGLLPPGPALWLPNLLLGGVGLYLFWQTTQERQFLLFNLLAVLRQRFPRGKSSPGGTP